jgi:LuxR family maltose regulon positive regulatory protein
MEWGKIDPLLKTKFQSPYLPNDFIPRNDLVTYFVKNLDKPLILVSSGSGSGKSLFVSSCLPQVPFDHAWVSLDPTDNDMRNFLGYFIAAIRQSIPDFGERSRAFVAAPRLPAIKEITHSVINDLNNIEEDFLLVLDDLHLIDNPKIYTLLSSLLEFPPPHFHLVLITRTIPPLPLERLRAKNKLAEILAPRMRLSFDEIKMFVEQNLSFPHIDPLVKILEEKTEGWVTGLRLAMLHLSFRKGQLEESIRILKETNFSEKYFMDEVLYKLDPEVTEFLLKTSILKKFTSSLTDHILGITGRSGRSDGILKNIMQMNLFMVNLDSSDKWFRYHHLFQDFLLSELGKRYPEKEIRRLHERAIDWYEANGFLEEAFYHAGVLEDREKMAEMIEEHMDVPLSENRWYVLDEWLSKLPESYLQQRPSLLVALMWVMHNKATWAIIDLLERLEKMGEDVEFTNEIKVQIRFFRGVIQFWSVRIGESLKSFEYVRKNLPRNKRGAEGFNHFYYLLASHMAGRGEEAVYEVEKLLLNESLDPFYRAVHLGGIAYVKMLEGNLDEVENLAYKIREISLETRDPFLIIWVENLLGMVCFYQNRLEEAEEHFAKTLDNVYVLNLLGPLDSFAGYLLTAQTLGMKKDLERVHEKMNDFVKWRSNPAVESFVNSFLARMAILDGNIEKAGKYMNNVNMYFESGNLFFWVETPRITYGKYLLALNDPEKTEEASGHLEKIAALARKTNNFPQLVQVLVLQAVVRKHQGDEEGARALLTEALEWGQAGTWIRPFFEGGAEIRDLLEQLELSPSLERFREKIFRNFDNYTLPGLQQGENDPDTFAGTAGQDVATLLTNRELDVLILLAGRFSNKEIANRLYISVATVKRHAITIYRKLGVNRRREAVYKAEKLGILHPQHPEADR